VSGRRERGLECHGTVRLATGRGRCLVRGTGDRLVLEADHPDVVRALLASPAWRRPRGERRRLMRRVDRALRAVGLGLELSLRGALLARLGDGATPRAWTRWLGLGPLELRWPTLLRLGALRS
jgi:hypothetical protein